MERIKKFLLFIALLNGSIYVVFSYSSLTFKEERQQKSASKCERVYVCESDCVRVIEGKVCAHVCMFVCMDLWV